MRKKKIFIVVWYSKSSAYGIGTYLVNIIESLLQAGIDFSIVELNAPFEELSVKWKNGVEWVSIPFSIADEDEAHPECFFRDVAYLLRELIPDNPDFDLIFHLNFLTDSTLVCHLKKLFKCKIVLTIHYTDWSFEFLGDTTQLNNILTKRKDRLNDDELRVRTEFKNNIKMAQKCDQVIYIANHSENTLSRYIKAKNKTVINNGLRDSYRELSLGERDSMRMKYFISPKSKVIIFAGRLEEVKGVKYLIKAFREVLLKHPDAILVIAGDGKFRPLFNEAEDIWFRVIFTGLIKKSKLYELYRIADCGVVSSIYEEFGYVAVEMMMHGLPVIVGDTGGLAEIVEDGVSGYKIPVVTREEQRGLDTKLLASKINLLLEDSDLAARLGKGGRQRFLEKYELSIFRNNMISLFNNL